MEGNAPLSSKKRFHLKLVVESTVKNENGVYKFLHEIVNREGEWRNRERLRFI